MRDDFVAKSFNKQPPGIAKSTKRRPNLKGEVMPAKQPFDLTPKPPVKKMHADGLEEMRRRHGADGYDGFHAGYGRNNKDGYED